jgi:putative SOS response-associated peptidase YedK
MCGRFANAEDVKFVAIRFGADADAEVETWKPTWNAAPTHRLPVVTQDAGGRHLGLMRWGWPIGFKPGIHVNAIGETARDRKSFAAAYRTRRCIVPASAFYEWRAADGKLKLPWAFQVEGGALFGIAALWQPIEVGGKTVPGFLLLTTVANRVVAPVHHRMASILPRAAEGAWLDPATPLDAIDDLMVPLDPQVMSAHRVSPQVNRVVADGMPVDGPELMKPVSDDQAALTPPGPDQENPPRDPLEDQESIPW